MNFTRITALIGAAALTASLAACGSDDGADSSGNTDTGTMQVMMFPAVAYRLPVIVAQEKGFFDDEGVQIDIIAQPNNLQGIQALEATNSQAGQVGTATLAQGAQAGSRIQAFCGGLDVVQSSLVASADSDLPSVHDGATPEEVFKALYGKKIGTQTPVGSAMSILIDRAVTDGGASNLSWVNIGGSNSVSQASLQNGSIDVAQTSPSGTQQLVETGVAKELAYMPDVSPLYGDLYGSLWVAPTDWLAANANTAKAFCDATATALEFILAPENHDEVLKLSMQDSGIQDEKVAEAVLKTYRDDYSADLSTEVVQNTFDKYVELGMVPAEPALDASELVNTVGR